jgi:hypothetical protein
MSKVSGTPKCPNHGCPLMIGVFPIPAVGTGKCPVSGADFDYQVAQDKELAGKGVEKGKDGELTAATTRFIVKGDESDNKVW